jgi:dinuclear metal center YbgI/SA1388 family protein
VSHVALSGIVEIADRLFPFDEAESWDNCGVQIGNPDRLVSSVAFSLDPTPRTLRFASSNSCDLLITHHPLLLEPLRSISADRFLGRTILDAARLGVDILSLHTNLDAAPGGLNDHLASTLGLQDVIIPLPARCARVGMLSGPLRVSALARKVGQDLSIPQIRVICEDDPEIQRVFIASGSGMGYFEEALRYRAEVVVTGDVRYHAAREALEMGTPVIDAGHYGLEKVAVRLLGTRFRKEFGSRGLQVTCIECDSEEEPFAPLP